MDNNGGANSTSRLTTGPPSIVGNRSTDEDQQNVSRKLEESKEAIKIIQEMSSILNTGLDAEALGLCIRLCESGANPKALAQLIKGWRQEKAQKDARSNGNF